MPLEKSENLRSSRVVILALVFGAYFTAQEIMTDFAQRRPDHALGDVWNGVAFWSVWAALTPIVFAVVRRWPIDARRPFSRALAVHGVVAVALASAQIYLAQVVRAIGHWLQLGIPWRVAIARETSALASVWGIFTGVLFYAMAVLVYTAIRFRGLYAAEQSNAAALAAELTQSKLDALRSQLRPHFLFNTLNAISIYVTEDAARAQQMILRLSTLLRRSLDEDAHEVPLSRELALANDYLEIQRARFGERLRVNVAVDPSVLDARVPVFLLQPLLENAIEHGRPDARSDDGSDDERTTITLTADRESDMLRITLADDGSGLSDEARSREGIGLGNTRARLRHLHGSRASVELEAAGSDAASGTRVAIRIPLGAPLEHAAS